MKAMKGKRIEWKKSNEKDFEWMRNSVRWVLWNIYIISLKKIIIHLLIMENNYIIDPIDFEKSSLLLHQQRKLFFNIS